MNPGALYLGIDLGTSNSTAALFDGRAVTVVRGADGSALTPSVVRIDAKGKVTVGARARRLHDSDPDNVRGEFKRLMGTEHTVTFPASGRAYRPEALSAEVLKSLREDVRQQCGVAPDRAVVTVPALFELPQTTATAEAARLAGFERVELLQEPVASAIAAGWKADADDPAPWLVYDLGGGTFDVSLLETQDGLLRVVGHDGDNFLGGRDLDGAVVDWAIARIAEETGATLRREDPAHAAALRRLKHAAEEARIELSRAREASLTIPAFVVGSDTVDVDLTLDRATHDALVLPLVDRSIAVCRRLLERHGLSQTRLSRVVLVGGPTVTPVLRTRVTEALGAVAGEGLDPMTLVAQGAALYAASVGLDARPQAPENNADGGPRVWLQYPAMSSDLSPWIVGRCVGDVRPTYVRFRRDDGAWMSDPEAPDAEGTFAVPVQLVAREASTFHVEGLDADGKARALTPATITIVHGVTIGDPPLSRSVGVALASDGVQVFFERGSPLPMRRTHTLSTVSTVARGATGYALDVPIVQGEFPKAHLCRLVGKLQIASEKVNGTLPAGSAIEVTLELDRGGRLSASARVPSLGQVFDEVAHLVAPKVPVEALRAQHDDLRRRTSEARGAAFRQSLAKSAAALARVEPLFVELGRDLAAAEGGDADAIERARRTLVDIDALLADAEAERAWPEMIETAREGMEWAVSWLSEFGTDTERRTIDGVAAALEKAITARNAHDVSRQNALARQLGTAAYLRCPGAWGEQLDHAESRVGETTDAPRAAKLIRDGRAAQNRGDTKALEQAVRDLWKLLPPNVEDRARGYGSGVR